jgi:glutaredoxin
MKSHTEVVMVTKLGCIPCIRIKRFLGELKVELPEIHVREVDFTSDEGMALAVKNSILYPPAVVINGLLFAKGKIMEEPLKEAVRKAARGE